MPINAGGCEQLPQKQRGIMPDISVDTPPLDIFATFWMENPNNSPACYPNWDELTPEEQAVIIGRYRYMGIRLRHDIDGTVPIRRETMELP